MFIERIWRSLKYECVFCNGPFGVNPFVVPRRRIQSSVRGRHFGPPHHPIRENRRADLETCGTRPKAGPLPNVRLRRFRVPATGPRGSRAPELAFLQTRVFSSQAVVRPAASRLQRNSVSSTHMRWSTVASFLAKATLARRMPRRFATSIAQCLKAESRARPVSMALAAS